MAMRGTTLALWTLAVAGAGLALSGTTGSAAVVETLPSGPILQIETGTHRSTIRDLAIRADGAVVVTVSDDKTMRLWDAHTGEALQVVRTPIGAQNDGVLNAVGYWPGESHIIAAGLTGGAYFTDSQGRSQNLFYFVRMASELQQIDLITTGGVVNSLDVFRPSPESPVRRLASAHSRNPAGVRVVDAKRQVLLEDDLGAPAVWVEFAPDGRLVAAAENGIVRLYDPDMKRVGEWRARDGRPAQARFSPDGAQIAVSFVDRPRIDILNAKSMKIRHNLSGADADGADQATLFLSAVAWRSGARSLELWASGGVLNRDRDITVRRWPDFEQAAKFENMPVSRDAVTRLETTPDNDVIFATGDPSWGRIDAQKGALAFRVDSQKADFRRVYERMFRASPNGAIVDFSFDSGDKVTSLRFDASQLAISSAPADAAEFTGQMPPRGLKDWQDNARPSLEGGRQVRMNNPRDIARSAAELADGRFVVGSDFALTLFTAAGAPEKEAVILSGATALVATSDGGRLVAAHRDGTIRWYDLAEGRELEELGALFLHGDGKRWLLWSPDGHFTHSEAGGQELAGYALNRGRKATAEWIDFSQLYSKYYDVELLRHRIGRAARAAAPVDDKPVDLDLSNVLASAPQVRLTQICAVNRKEGEDICLPASAQMRGLSRKTGSTADSQEPVIRKFDAAETLRVVFEATQAAEPIERFDVFVNGTTTGQQRVTRGMRRQAPDGAAPVTGTDGTPAKSETVTRDIMVAPGRSEIYVRAYGASGVFGKSQRIIIEVAPPPEVEKPNLYVIAVGIDVYQSDIQDLAFARADAMAVASELRARPSPGYDKVIVVDRMDGQATTEGVRQAFAEVAQHVRPIDSVAVYLAGHGIAAKDGDYYFITADVPDEQSIPDTAIGQGALIELLSSVRGANTIVMLDTCYSGAFSSNLSGTLGNNTGFFVLAASNSQQEALDGFDDKNGVFGHTILNGLSGAGGSIDGEVTVTNLGSYVQVKVPQFAGKKGHAQNAVFHTSGNSLTHFPLTSVP